MKSFQRLKQDLEQEKRKHLALQENLKKKEESPQETNSTQKRPISFSVNERAFQQQAEAYKKEYQAVLERFKKLTDAGKLDVRISGGRIVLVLPSDILFQSGSDIISRAGIRAIEGITKILIEDSDRKFQIEGHTDNVPIHTPRFPSNWELAAARSLNILHAMVASGMSPDRLSSASFADIRPVQANDTHDGRKANRRIEIALVPDFSELPRPSSKSKKEKQN